MGRWREGRKEGREEREGRKGKGGKESQREEEWCVNVGAGRERWECRVRRGWEKREGGRALGREGNGGERGRLDKRGGDGTKL